MTIELGFIGFKSENQQHMAHLQKQEIQLLSAVDITTITHCDLQLTVTLLKRKITGLPGAKLGIKIHSINAPPTLYFI